MPFRRALHTFGTPCTLRCTPFSIEVCRRFLLFSLVYEPFPMLSRLPARHAHLFSNDLYIREGIYIFSYIRLIKWCAWCAVPLNPLINQDLSCTLWPKMVCRIVCIVCRVVCSARRNARIGIACQAHAAPLLYVHPHPTAARRAATLALRTRSARNAHLLRTKESPTPLLMSVLPDHMTTRKNVVVTIWSAESLGAIRLFAIPDQMTTSFGTYLQK